MKSPQEWSKNLRTYLQHEKPLYLNINKKAHKIKSFVMFFASFIFK
jgi:hypothetical protein